jgi:hypothetical protein
MGSLSINWEAVFVKQKRFEFRINFISKMRKSLNGTKRKMGTGKYAK